ncbi:MAG TPA: IPT/TIG domain-containing protein [Thermoanaerobaculia bacterium]
MSRIAGAVVVLTFTAALLRAQTPPELIETDEGCPEQRVLDYLERHGDFGRIDPEVMLELSRDIKATLDAQRFNVQSINGSVWKSIGPTNGAGRATALALHPSLNGTAIIGAAGGGAWKTTDGGQTWRALTDDIPNLSVGALAYAPSDPNIIYLGTGEGGIAGDFIPGIGLLASSDGGETWTLPSAVIATQFYKFAIDPANAREVLAACNAGLLRSTNGQNGPWKPMIPQFTSGNTLGFGDATDIVRDPSDPKILYVTTWDRRAWCARANNACAAGQRVESPSVMKSMDGGSTWSPAAEGLPVSDATQRVNRMSIAIAPSNPSTLYLATSIFDSATGRETAHIYKTADNAATWTETSLSGSASLNTYMSTQGWYDNTLVVSPGNPDVVLAGGVTYVRTTDGGSNWTRVLNNVHVDAHELRYDAATLLWVANDGGIWTSPDDGDSATAHNAGLVTRQFYDIANDPANRNRVYGGQQDNGTVMRGDAGGTLWSGFTGSDGFACDVNPAAPAIVYSTTQGGNVERTVTAGTLNRIVARTPPYDSDETTPFFSIVKVDARNPSTLYTVSYRVWKSMSGGDGWLPLSTDLTSGGPWRPDSQTTIRALAVSPSDPNAIMVATTRRRIFRTTDGGATWSDVTTGDLPGRTIVHLEIDATDARHALAALAGTSGPSIWETTDGGGSWHARATGLPSFSAQTVRFDPTDPNTIYAGTDVGVYRSTDSGASWQRFGTGMPAVSVYDLEPLADGSILRAATHGRGVWELDIAPPQNAPPSVAITTPATSVVVVLKGTTLSFAGTVSANDSAHASWMFPDTWTSVAAPDGIAVKHRFERAGRFPVGLSAVDSRGGIGAATVEVDVVEAGDSCASPIQLPSSGPFPYSATVTTDLATSETSDPQQLPSCYPFTLDSSTWLSFTAATAGDYQFSLCGSAIPAVLIGYTGQSCDAFTADTLCVPHASTAFDCSSSFTTKTVALNAGDTIRLLVTNYFSNLNGDVTVTVTRSSALTPLVASVAPASGAPGTAVVINGVGFQSGAAVKFGGIPATNAVVVSSKIISATIPQNAAGTVSAVVQNPDGTTATLANAFSYVFDDAGPKRRAIRR